MEIPFEYLKKASGHEFNDQLWNHVNQMLTPIRRTEKLSDLDFARQMFTDYKAKAERGNQPFMEMIDTYRGQIRSRNEHSQYMNAAEARQAHLDVTKQLLTKLVGDVNLDWNEIDFFLKTFDEWLRQLAIDPNTKMKINDWADLSNLVYVMPGSLYWTEDYKKTTKYIKDSGCAHYLYNLL